MVNYAPGSRTSSFINLRRDQTFVVRIQSVDTSDGTVIGRFAWRFEEDDAFEYETTIYSSTDDTTARELMKTGTDGRPIATGVSVFWDATLKGTTAFAGEIAVGDEYRFTLPYNEGITFDESDSNTAHLEVECSGRGSCDGATGKCKCQKGYTGSACERSEWRGYVSAAESARRLRGTSCAPSLVPSLVRSRMPERLLRPRHVPVGGAVCCGRQHLGCQVRRGLRRHPAVRLQVRRRLPWRGLRAD